MKKFNKDDKINFVDENNVFVGYDLIRSCCEHADWFISDKEKDTTGDIANKYDISAYVFDTKYFAEVASNDVDAGGMVRFKLVSPDKPNLFLHLFNSHNGYYSHGFEAKIGDEKWKDGNL